MPRNFKNLNRRELHKLIKYDISEFVFNEHEKPSNQESSSAERIESVLNIKLRHFPRIVSPQNRRTPDFATAKEMVAIEIKATTSLKNGFGNAFEKANKQLKILKDSVATIILINVDGISKAYEMSEIIEKSRREATFRNISLYAIELDNRIIFCKT